MIKKFKIKVCQKIADIFISKLEKAPTDIVFNKIMRMAKDFDGYCAGKEIYLN